MNNKDKFKIGTKFIGDINKASMEIISIKDKGTGTESGRYAIASKVAIIKDLKNGKLFNYGLKALERCNVTIIEG